MPLPSDAARQHLRQLLAHAQTEALLEALRQIDLPDVLEWSDRLQVLHAAYEEGLIPPDVWLREYGRVFGAILQQLGPDGRPDRPLTTVREIEALVLARHIGEALQRCRDTSDETLLLHAQYALGRREWENGRMTQAQWELLQHHIGYALMAAVKATERSRPKGCVWPFKCRY